VAVTLTLVSVAHAGPSSWTIVSSPDPNAASGNLLSGVAAHSPHDVWAVGMTDAQMGPQTLTMHWNGTSWQYVPSPSVPGQNTILSAVAEVSPHDVWAVGFANPGNTLTEHWNGVSWSIIPSPSPGAPDAFDVLNGVAALAHNNVWAVGYEQRGSDTRTLIEHWNGASWTVVPSPNAPIETNTDQLNSVTALAPNDVWAVGNYTPPGPPCAVTAYTLVEHWDGTSWQIVPSANVNAGTDFNQLVGVSGDLASGSDDLWAVGSDAPPSNCMQPLQSFTLIEHWNGAAWQIVSSANVMPAQEENSLEGVTALSPSDVWAVGAWGSFQSVTPHVPQSLIEHWNGVSWTVTSSPNAHPNVDSNVLSAVAAATSNDVWAVGNFDDATTLIQSTLTERYH
jgi:hypothetical protein